MIAIDGFDYQVSCMLRKTQDGTTLKGCPFSYSDGHGDQSCLLLMALEMERLQKAESDKEIVWAVDDVIETVFGDIPPKERYFTVLAEWKFPDCPMREMGGEQNE